MNKRINFIKQTIKIILIIIKNMITVMIITKDHTLNIPIMFLITTLTRVIMLKNKKLNIFLKMNYTNMIKIQKKRRSNQLKFSLKLMLAQQPLKWKKKLRNLLFLEPLLNKLIKKNKTKIYLFVLLKKLFPLPFNLKQFLNLSLNHRIIQ